MNTIEKFNNNVMATYGRYPLVMESGKDECATDENGKKYIDFGSGIGTNSLGYCNEDWVNAVCEQVKTLQHTSNYYYTKVQADFADKFSKSDLLLRHIGHNADEVAESLFRNIFITNDSRIIEVDIIPIVQS